MSGPTRAKTVWLNMNAATIAVRPVPKSSAMRGTYTATAQNIVPAPTAFPAMANETMIQP